MRRLQHLALVFVLVMPGCAARSDADLTPSQQLGTAGVAFYQTVGHAGVLTSNLEEAGVVTTDTAVRIHEELLEINTAQKPFTDGLRLLDSLENLPEGSRLDQVEYVLGLLNNVSVHLDDALGNVPVSDAARQLIEVFQEARTTIEMLRAQLQPILAEGGAQ